MSLMNQNALRILLPVVLGAAALIAAGMAAAGANDEVQ